MQEEYKDDIRHWSPDYTYSMCGEDSGWWVKTPSQVTCRACRDKLPCTVHWAVRPGIARCGRRDLTPRTGTDNPRLVTCGRCVPRPKRGKSKTIHYRRPPEDPLDTNERALCNLPYATRFTADWGQVNCGLCKSRWSPACRFCGRDKPSRDPVCRQPECRKLHKRETA